MDRKISRKGLSIFRWFSQPKTLKITREMNHVIAILRYWLADLHIISIYPLNILRSNYKNTAEKYEENFCKKIV